MKKLLFALALVAPIFAQSGSGEAVPVGIISVAVIAAGAAGFGAFRLIKKDK